VTDTTIADNVTSNGGAGGTGGYSHWPQAQ
jgi:hypothetical protein